MEIINDDDKKDKKNNVLKNETTLDRIIDLQNILKKESTLKGLYSQTGNGTKKDIEILCREIFSQKISLYNILKNKPNINRITNFQLIENNKEYLKHLYLFIPKLLTNLWENPSLIAQIIMNAKNSDIQKYLAPLICNNFYENILSTNYIEDQLIYIIYLLLENEINKMENIEKCKYFLNNTPCGYLLDELIEKRDIKAFFKIILKDIIENMEITSGDAEIILDSYIIEQIVVERLNNQKKNNKKNQNNSNNAIKRSVSYSDIVSNIEDKKQNEIFRSKYLLNLPLKRLKEVKEEFKNDNNLIMENYIDIQLKEQNSNDMYSNKRFYELINNKPEYEPFIVIEYENSFMKVINFIDSLLNSFLENMDLFPYSIRCIGKIISFLIEKKFKDISPIEKYMFISQFFVYKILLPITIKPASSALINEYIISSKTLQKLNVIVTILIQFFSFKLYKSEEKGSYTPFNCFFLDNITKITKIYDNMIKVKLPSFIEKLIKGEEDSNYEYNYFKENKNEILFHRSIFLTVNHINPLINEISKIQKLSDENQILIDKLVKNEDNKKFFEQLCKDNELTNKVTIKPNKAKGQKKKEIKTVQTKNYFLLSDLIFNEKNQKILIDNNQRYFKLKESKNNKDNTIIKTKNIISTLLCNFRSLNETDFQEKEMINSMEIFKKLRILIKSTDSVMDDKIPNDWYIELLLEYLKKLPSEYKENDYHKLYEELKKDIEKSIKQYNFEELSMIIDKKLFGNKIKDYFIKEEAIIRETNLNMEVNDIIEKYEINVKLFFKYNNEKKELNIYQEDMGDKQLDFLDSFIFVDANQKAKLCKTIDSFIKYFPDLNIYANEKNTVFNIEKELNVPDNLSNFFNIIRNYLQKKGLEQIYVKVYDYVMSKLYHKICPQTLNIMDEKLYQKVRSLSWIEPNHINENIKDYNYELVLPDITRYFNYINIEKSPKKKIENMQNIFASIGKLLSFSQKHVIGVDDQMPLLNYIFIRAKPKGMYTNLEFMELYMGDKIKKKEGNNLAQLKTIRDFIFNLSASNLTDVSKEDFEDNCKKALEI